MGGSPLGSRPMPNTGNLETSPGPHAHPRPAPIAAGPLNDTVWAPGRAANQPQLLFTQNSSAGRLAALK